MESAGLPAIGHMLRAALLAGSLLIGAGGLTGCLNPRPLDQLFTPTKPVTTAPAPLADVSPSEPTTKALPTLMQMSFDVLRTQAPTGVFSQSGKVWNHLDEQIVPTELKATLQRNGFRLARGKMDAWRPIKAILDGEKGVQCFPNSMTMFNGLPLTLELDSKPHDQTVFLIRQDGSMGGKTFPASMNLIRLEYSVPVTEPNSVVVDIMPELRLEPPEPRLTANGWQERPLVPPSRVFRELSARIVVGPDEFLALGPSPAVQQAHSIGSLMLCKEVNSEPTESMLFITPRVVRKAYSPILVPSAGQPAGTP